MFRELRGVYSIACGECTSLEKTQGFLIVLLPSPRPLSNLPPS